MVLSDGGGWNGEAAAGCPVVVVVDVVGGVVIVGAGGGGDGVAVLAGAAGAVRRAGRGFGASTVTCGIATAGAVPGSAGGVSGAGRAGCGAGVSGARVGGVSGGVVVAGGVSGGVAGVCDDATPPKQSSMSAELLSRSTRLLWMDIARPTSLTGTTRQPRRSTHPGETTPDGESARPSLAREQSETTIDVRRWGVRARGIARRVMWSDQIQRRPRAATCRKRRAAAATGSRPAPTRRRDGSACRSGSGRRRGVHDRLDWTARRGRRPMPARPRARSRTPRAARRARDARARTKPRAGTPAQTAPDTHPISNATGTSAWSSASRVFQRAEPFCRAVETFSNNVTFAKMRPHCNSSGVLQKINIARGQLRQQLSAGAGNARKR